MPPTWPKTIFFGQVEVSLENGRKTGFPKTEIAEGFWPAARTSENVSRRTLCARIYA